VASLPSELAFVVDRRLALVVVTDPGELSPTQRDFAEFFGLSPAECRLAVALMTGKSLRDIASDSRVQITTVRTQLSSILKKVGVKRQADLVRIFSRIPVVADSNCKSVVGIDGSE